MTKVTTCASIPNYWWQKNTTRDWSCYHYCSCFQFTCAPKRKHWLRQIHDLGPKFGILTWKNHDQTEDLGQTLTVETSKWAHDLLLYVLVLTSHNLSIPRLAGFFPSESICLFCLSWSFTIANETQWQPYSLYSFLLWITRVNLKTAGGAHWLQRWIPCPVQTF